MKEITYSREDLLDFIRDHYDLYQEVPYLSDMPVSNSPFIRCFGSWENALAEVGLTPRMVIKPSAPKPHAAECESCGKNSNKFSDNLIQNMTSVHNFVPPI